MPRPEHAELLELLNTSTGIAVVGASPNPARPSHWISRFLMTRGYQVYPVNPGHSELLDQPCYPDITSIQAPIHVVNIFRRSDSVVPVVESAIQKGGVRLIWMQDNVYNEAAAELAQQAGIAVVMDDCIYRFLQGY